MGLAYRATDFTQEFLVAPRLPLESFNEEYFPRTVYHVKSVRADV